MTALAGSTDTTTAADVHIRADLAEHLPVLRRQLDQQEQFRHKQLDELAEAAITGASGLSVDDPRDEVTDVIRTGANSALLEIRAALGRMSAGTYGRCEECGNDIPLERLEVLPMASLCMRCQRRHEARAGVD